MERQIEETKPNKMVRNLEIFKDEFMENTLVFVMINGNYTMIFKFVSMQPEYNKHVSEAHFKLRI